MKKRNIGWMVLVMVFSTAGAFAQDPDYVLSVSGPDDPLPNTGPAGSPGDSVNVACDLDDPMGGNIAGWSWGLCDSSTEVNVTAVVEGSTTMTLGDGGGSVAFHAPALFPDGWTVGVVIDFFGNAVLPPGNGYQLELATYAIDAAASTDSKPLDYCSTLGMPAVVITLVLEGGSAVTATTSGGSIEVLPLNDMFAGNDNEIVVLGNNVDIGIGLDTVEDVFAAQVALTYDDTLVSFVGAANDTGADFFEANGGGGELTAGLITDTDGIGDSAIPAGVTIIMTTTWSGDAEGTSPLDLTSGLGSPVIDSLIILSGGVAQEPNLFDGSIQVVNFNPFVRGNCNDDASGVNIADAVYLLSFLFLMGPDPVCDDACDANDDEALDSSDPIYILNYRFLGGPPPSAPFPDPDIDPTNAGDPPPVLGCNGDADDI